MGCSGLCDNRSRPAIFFYELNILYRGTVGCTLVRGGLYTQNRSYNAYLIISYIYVDVNKCLKEDRRAHSNSQPYNKVTVLGLGCTLVSGWFHTERKTNLHGTYIQTFTLRRRFCILSIQVFILTISFFSRNNNARESRFCFFV